MHGGSSEELAEMEGCQRSDLVVGCHRQKPTDLIEIQMLHDIGRQYVGVVGEETFLACRLDVPGVAVDEQDANTDDPVAATIPLGPGYDPFTH